MALARRQAMRVLRQSCAAWRQCAIATPLQAAVVARRGVWCTRQAVWQRGLVATPAVWDDEPAAESPAAEAEEGEGEGEGEEEEEHDPRATLEEQTKSDEELAKNHMYFELLVNYWRENDEVPWYRIDEIKSTDKLVMVVNRFASMKAVVPELFDGLEERGVWASQNLESLNGAYLATLAWSYARVGLGSDDLFSAIQSAASACADMSEADQQNIDWAVATRA